MAPRSLERTPPQDFNPVGAWERLALGGGAASGTKGPRTEAGTKDRVGTVPRTSSQSPPTCTAGKRG